MTSSLRGSHREFLRHVGVAGCAAPFVARCSWAASPNEILRHASFGASGMAAADIESITRHPKVRLVAVADVDLPRANELKQKFRNVPAANKRVRRKYRKGWEVKGLS
jgi:hypothetical protein